jgi:hypothetical protein
MNEFIKMLETLNNLCDILNARGGATYSVIDWVFGFIVFENGNSVCDGNFTNVVKYLTNKL